jgi:subfamily B ATP-binding cassette protein MsbA
MGNNNKKWYSYLSKYKGALIGSGLLNLGYSIFTLISIPLIIPFFQLLFENNSGITSSSSSLEIFIHRIFEALILQNGKEHALFVVCILFVLAIVVRNIFRYFSLYVMAPVRNGIVADLRVELFSKIFSLPITYFSEEKKGDLISKSIADVTEVEWSILNFIESIFRSPLLMLGALGIMIAISPIMTLVVMSLVICTILILRLVGKPIKNVSKTAQVALGNITSSIEEGITGVKVIKSYNAEASFKSSFAEKIDKFKTAMISAFRIRDLGAPISETLGMSIVGILMFIGAKQVFDNSLAPESFFAFLFAFYQVIEPAKTLSNGYFNIQKGMAAVDRINDVLNIKDDIKDHDEVLKLSSFTNEIEFKDVSFSYANAKEVAIDHVSFTIKKGSKVALVGPSGSGKTTIINLLSRFYSPTHGSILLDNKSIDKYDLTSLRSKIGLVTQDSILFNDTVKNNLSLGKKIYTDQDIQAALSFSYASEFVDQLDNGINEMIGDNGIKLSGGQKQRLNIARAILHKPEILIFDEATSALDTNSEKMVQKSIDEVSTGKTSIVIAHRISTIMNSDLIILLDKGKVNGIGNHTKLLNENKLYQELVKNQFI